MTTTIALLRGINVGGHNKLPMATLRSLCAGLGFDNARTYVQSGNLAFETDTADPGATLSAAIRDQLGLDVPVITRTRAAVAAALAATPFPDGDPKFVHVVFLSDTPEPSAVAALPPDRSPGDRYEVIGRDLHVHYGNGAGKSKLTMPWLERHLGVCGTGRNLRTVRALLDLADRR